MVGGIRLFRRRQPNWPIHKEHRRRGHRCEWR